MKEEDERELFGSPFLYVKQWKTYQAICSYHIENRGKMGVVQTQR